MLVDVFAARFVVVGASDFRKPGGRPLVVPPWQMGAGAQAVDRKRETQPTGVLQDLPLSLTRACNKMTKTGRLALANVRNTNL